MFVTHDQEEALTMSDTIVVMYKEKFNKWEHHKIYTMNLKIHL